MKRRRRTPRTTAGTGQGAAQLSSHPDWPEFCGLLLQALREFPEAKAAVIEAMKKMAKNTEERK